MVVARPVKLSAGLGALAGPRWREVALNQPVAEAGQNLEVNAAVGFVGEQGPDIFDLVECGADVEQSIGAIGQQLERGPIFLAVLPTVQEHEGLAWIERGAGAQRRHRPKEAEDEVEQGRSGGDIAKVGGQLTPPGGSEGEFLHLRPAFALFAREFTK